MIPKLHFSVNRITKEEQLAQVQKACSAGVELIQLDLQHIDKKNRLTYAEDVLKITQHYQTRLIIVSEYLLAKTIKADGVYLGKNDVCPALVRTNMHKWQSVGAAARTLRDCELLIEKKVDYIMLGPFNTNEKSNTTSLGLNDFTTICETLNTAIPIVAFGNITRSEVTDLIATGIYGISVNQSITSNFNDIKTFHKLLNASSTQEMRHSFEKSTPST